MSSFTSPLIYNPTGDYYEGNPTYCIIDPFTYSFGSQDAPITTFTVPSGFVTDFASIPFPFNRIFKPDGPWAKAAVLHDWICNNEPGISKVVQDSIFLEAMEVLGINKVIAVIFFITVRIYRSFIG